MLAIVPHSARRALTGLAAAILGDYWKEWNELRFWQKRKEQEGRLGNAHYRRLFTEQFDLTAADYQGKSVLDVGCGPRGSLEWATMTSRRVGLDSLAKKYLGLGARDHQMEYVAAPAEKMPFPDATFDIVATFNSLDHVANVDRVLAELKRVIKSGGMLLLIVEVNHAPTPTEPQTVSPAVLDRLAPEFSVVSLVGYRDVPGGLYGALERGTAELVTNPAAMTQPGWLSARLVRMPRPA